MGEMQISRNITHLAPKIIYEHSVELSHCESPRVRNMSLYYLFEAAQKGNPEALNDLGYLALNKASELNLDKDCYLGIGIILLKESAKQGNCNALMNLAFQYLIGKGVKQDIELALNYYGHADELGDPDAIKAINYIEFNVLTASDPKSALKLIMDDRNFFSSKEDKNFRE